MSLIAVFCFFGMAIFLHGQAHMLIAKTQWLPASICLGLLAGCSGAPSQNILGSYFPSWMICALIGLFASILAGQVLNAVGVGKSVPAPILLYLSLAVAFSFGVWLAWIG